MRTNFEHLRKYPELKADATAAEEALLEEIQLEQEMSKQAGRTYADAKCMTKRKGAGNMLRQVLEGLLEILCNLYGIAFKPHDLFENMKNLEAMGIFNKKSLDNLHTIRKIGNKCSHRQGKPGKAEVRRMYELMYQESYKMINFYMKEETVAAYMQSKKQGGYKAYNQKPQSSVQKYSAQKSTGAKVTSKKQEESGGMGAWLLVGVAFVVIVFFLMGM